MAGSAERGHVQGLRRLGLRDLRRFLLPRQEGGRDGGGNTAVEEALHLSNIAAHVTVIHRRDSFRAEKILTARLASRHNVSIRWNSVVDGVLGEAPPLGVNAIRLRNAVTGALDDLAVDGVFVAIGHEPATELVRGQVALEI